MTAAVPITIVVPCCNEEEGLSQLAVRLHALRDAFRPRYAVAFVLVDDGSTDRTWDIARELFAAWPDCTLVRHSQNRGVAAAIVTGTRAATSEIVCSMDSDCTYDPMQFLDLLPSLEDSVALVTASPYHRDGAVRGVGPVRLFLSRSLSRLYRVVLRPKLRTYTSCFRVYRRSVVLALQLRHGGFLGIAEMIGRIDQAGHDVVECPAVLETRRYGRSKMRILRTIIGHLGLVARFGAERLRARPAGGPVMSRRAS